MERSFAPTSSVKFTKGTNSPFGKQYASYHQTSTPLQERQAQIPYGGPVSPGTSSIAPPSASYLPPSSAFGPPPSAAFTPATAKQTSIPARRAPRAAPEPPIADLWQTGDGMESGAVTSSQSTLDRSTMHQWGRNTTSNDGTMTPVRASQSSMRYMTPGQADPFNTQGDSLTCATVANLPETCVTVFGYAPNDASLVMSEFHKHGYIIKFHVDPVGNWMHLQFEDAMQAKHALSADGFVFGADSHRTMIGVRPCIDQSFLSSASNLETRSGVLGTEIPKRTPARSLNPRSQEPVSITNAPVQTPQKNTSYIDMAKDLLFGW